MTPLARHARHPSIRTRGVSLIEALVAMAVMAFGMLAVMGVQTTLRINADVAKQRSEATRVAEEEIERLRAFRSVQAVADASLDWDEVVQQLGTAVNLPGNNSNTTYLLNRRVVRPAGSAQKSISVEVTWQDRLGDTQRVILGDTLAGAAPVLSGLVSSAAAVRTAAAQRNSRHPTIPVRAHDMGNGESVFKPTEGGTVAWTFDNTTGVITSVCVVAVVKTSATLVAADVVVGLNCTATKAQLLAGYVSFNLRGASKDLATAPATSVFKPIAGGNVAWVIDHAQSRIVRSCNVAGATRTSTLLDTDVPPGCGAAVPVSPVIAPFDPTDPVNDVNPALTAVDSQNPAWPALPLDANTPVLLAITSGNRPALSEECFSDAPGTAALARTQAVVEYFCIIYPDTNGLRRWKGQSTLLPAGFSDAGGAPWVIGAVADTYRICRYTPAAAGVATVNANHPSDYDYEIGNLINQNFLVIAGPKSCPTDVAADPATGDFVNSNTLQHQP